jgi:hypothetical protein
MSLVIRSISVSCLVAAFSLGTIRGATAAQVPLGSLLLRAHDLGSGYFDRGSGYRPDGSAILQFGMPVPGRTPTTSQLRQHGFVREFFDSIWSKRVLKRSGRVFNAAGIDNVGDQFTSAAGAHWAFVEVKRLRKYEDLFRAYAPLAPLGDESFGILPNGCGETCRGVIFRQGKYLVYVDVWKNAPSALRLVALARAVASRIQRQG